MNTSDYTNCLVSIEIAKKLKEAGFSEECYFITVYKEDKVSFMTKNKERLHLIDDIYKDNHNRKNDIYSIPTWGKVIEWFNERGLLGNIEYEGSGIYSIRIVLKDTPSVRTNNEKYLSYSRARTVLIEELIKIYRAEVLTECK